MSLLMAQHKMVQFFNRNTQQFLNSPAVPLRPVVTRQIESDWKAAMLLSDHSFDFAVTGQEDFYELREHFGETSQPRSSAGRALLSLSSEREKLKAVELESALDEQWDFLQVETERFRGLWRANPQAHGYGCVLEGLTGMARALDRFHETDPDTFARQIWEADRILSEGREMFRTAA